MRMYLLAVVPVLSPETVSAYSSQGSTALQVGVPVACEDGLATGYGPPVKVSDPLLSFSVPPTGAIAAFEPDRNWTTAIISATASQICLSFKARVAMILNFRKLDCAPFLADFSDIKVSPSFRAADCRVCGRSIRGVVSS